MQTFWIFIGAAAVLLALVLLISYICFRIGFYVPNRTPGKPEEILFPEGEVYERFREPSKKWVEETRALPHEDVCITSFDGLKLWGSYYELAPGAPIELMLHGYRGTAERDLPCGVRRAFRTGRSALVVDQRCSGRSEGNVITFGIKEHRDCLAWVDFMIEKFGPDVKIILTGLSMGASTVLMAAGTELPENVVGVLADCGFDSPKSIIKTVTKQMGLPAELVYPFIKLGARMYGGFDLEETSAVEAVKRCKIPVIFFHGESDDYVPCHMSRVNYEACASRKHLVTVPGAGHGLSYPVAPDRYVAEVKTFFGPEAARREDQPVAEYAKKLLQ